jgi:mycothiol synthase
VITQATIVDRLDPAGSDIPDIHALLDAATAADGSAPVGEHGLHRLRTGDGPHVLIRDPDTGLVGYAQLDRTGPGEASAELVAHPKARRRSVGAELVAQLLELTGDVALQVWAHGNLPGAVGLARRFDFEQVRELWQMRRSLDAGADDDAAPPLGPVELPDGVRLRAFQPGRDEAEFLRVNNAAFDWHPEQGGWGLDQVEQREAEPWFDAEGFLLAVDEKAAGKLLGYHWTKVHTEADSMDGRIGEVYVLGVDPAAQGRRLGGALTLAGLHHLRERGLHDVMLYVEADNHAAVRVYEKLGFARWHTDAAYRHTPRR